MAGVELRDQQVQVKGFGIGSAWPEFCCRRSPALEDTSYILLVGSNFLHTIGSQRTDGTL